MRIQTIRVFDEIIEGSGPWYTGTQHEQTIGAGDRFAIQAVTTGVSGTEPKLIIRAEHSPDGEHWLSVGEHPEIDADIAENGTLVGAQSAHCPSRHVRLRIELDGSGAKCRLVAYVTVRASSVGWVGPGGGPSLAGGNGNGNGNGFRRGSRR